MLDLARRLTRLEACLEACRIATPKSLRWVIAKTEAEAAAAGAARQPWERLGYLEVGWSGAAGLGMTADSTAPKQRELDGHALIAACEAIRERNLA